MQVREAVERPQRAEGASRLRFVFAGVAARAAGWQPRRFSTKRRQQLSREEADVRPHVVDKKGERVQRRKTERSAAFFESDIPVLRVAWTVHFGVVQEVDE